MKILGVSIEATLGNILRLSFHTFLVLFSSFFLTWSFRRWLLPNADSLELPLNFVFQTCPHGGVCSFPTANVSVVMQSGTSFFEAGTAYKISLNLLLPDTPINRNLGMFLVVLNFHPSKDIVSQSLIRSAVLPYHSIAVRMMRILFYFPLLLLQWTEESEAVIVEFTSRYLDNVFTPTTGLSVQLQHHALQVHSGTLRITASFGVVRSFMYHWPLTSSTVLFLMWGSLFSGTMMLYWSQKSLSYAWDIVGTLESIGNKEDTIDLSSEPPLPRTKEKKEEERTPGRNRARNLAKEFLRHPIDENFNDDSLSTPNYNYHYDRKRRLSSPEAELRQRILFRAHE